MARNIDCSFNSSTIGGASPLKYLFIALLYLRCGNLALTVFEFASSLSFKGVYVRLPVPGTIPSNTVLREKLGVLIKITIFVFCLFFFAFFFV